MKKQIKSALLGFVAVLALAAAAHAQAARAIRVQVPFEFAAGGKQMPAGLYTVRRVRVDSESVLVIRGEGGGDSAVVLTTTGRGTAARASLTFRQHGDRYFLAEVSVPGTASVRQLPKTGGERRVERELIEEARAGRDPKQVTLVGSVQ
ncbi:MAG TPA: hypothetical protein VF736_20990 [Pyrinomonadaceae bacterium]|jgi:hypothetical protein